MKKIFLFLCVLSACTAKEEPTALPQRGIEIPGLEEFREVSKRTFKIKKNDAEEVRFSKGKTEITLRSITDASVESFSKSIDLREFELSRTFRAERSPYPGAVTDDVRCPENFRPRLTRVTGPNRWFWRAEIYASSRKTQVCSETDFVLKSVEIIAYCPNSKKLITVQAFTPKNEASIDWATWLSTANCRD
jgi:hypothetical protein